jgi:DNA-binding HxlR family transcriptional regulator
MSVKLSSPQAFRIVKYLLEHPITYQRQIQRDLKISISWINRVVNSLFEAGIAKKGKWRRIELEDPYALLDLLSWQRPLQRLLRATIQLELTELEQAEKSLREKCLKAKLDYALTAFSGLSRYLAYYITFPTIHTYAHNPEQLSQLLPRGRGPITVEVLLPDYPHILKSVGKINGFNVVDPIQVVIDLFCWGSAGRDAATKLYEKIRREQQWNRLKF